MKITAVRFKENVRIPHANEKRGKLVGEARSPEYKLDLDEIGWVWIELEGGKAVGVPPVNIVYAWAEQDKPKASTKSAK